MDREQPTPPRYQGRRTATATITTIIAPHNGSSSHDDDHPLNRGFFSFVYKLSTTATITITTPTNIARHITATPAATTAVPSIGVFFFLYLLTFDDDGPPHHHSTTERQCQMPDTTATPLN